MAKSRDAVAAEVQKAQGQNAELTTQLQAQTEKVRELQEQFTAATASAEPSGTQAIQNPAIYSFATTRPRINAGQSSTLSWQISNADRIRIEPDIGTVGALGSRTVTPLKTTTYTLIATNKAGESRVTRRIEVF
jgi:cell division septum initiation protein DivIVA